MHLATSIKPRVPLEILIVDDQAINQMVMKGYLERLGYYPHITDRGWKAIEAVENLHFDVVFMDIQMPEMDGIEAAQRIRRRHGSAIKIVATTALSIDAGTKLKTLGFFDGFIQKPVRPCDLMRFLAPQYEKQTDTRPVPTIEEVQPEQLVP